MRCEIIGIRCHGNTVLWYADVTSARPDIWLEITRYGLFIFIGQFSYCGKTANSRHLGVAVTSKTTAARLAPPLSDHMILTRSQERQCQGWQSARWHYRDCSGWGCVDEVVRECYLWSAILSSVLIWCWSAWSIGLILITTQLSWSLIEGWPVLLCLLLRGPSLAQSTSHYRHIIFLCE